MADERVDLNKANKDGDTPFIFACFHRSTEVVKILMADERMDVNQANKKQDTPFMGLLSGSG